MRKAELMMNEERMDATPLLLRRLALDFTPIERSDEICSWLGLVPEAPDVSEAEHKDSHKRLSKCQPLMPQVEICTGLLTKIVRTVAENEDIGLDEEHLNMLSAQFHMATGSAIYTVLAQLFDSDLIQYGKAILPQLPGMLM